MSANYTISAVIYRGLSVTTGDGKPATLAVIDADGNVIASGREVEEAAWDTSLQSYRNFLIGQGHMRVLSKPPGLPAPTPPERTA